MESPKELKIGIFFDTNILVAMLFEDFRRKIYRSSEFVKDEKERFYNFFKENEKIRENDYFKIAKEIQILKKYLEEVEKNSYISFVYFVTPNVLDETLKKFRRLIKCYSKEMGKTLYKSLEEYINNFEGKIKACSYKSNGNGYTFSLLGFIIHSYKQLDNNHLSKAYLEGKVDQSDLKHISDVIYIKSKKGLNYAFFVTLDEKIIKNYEGAIGLNKFGILVLLPENVKDFFKLYIETRKLDESANLIGIEILSRLEYGSVYQSLSFKTLS